MAEKHHEMLRNRLCGLFYRLDGPSGFRRRHVWWLAGNWPTGDSLAGGQRAGEPATHLLWPRLYLGFLGEFLD
jgi:hypothetical protein